jgi:hypothetical protein
MQRHRVSPSLPERRARASSWRRLVPVGCPSGVMTHARNESPSTSVLVNYVAVAAPCMLLMGKTGAPNFGQANPKSNFGVIRTQVSQSAAALSRQFPEVAPKVFTIIY